MRRRRTEGRESNALLDLLMFSAAQCWLFGIAFVERAKHEVQGMGGTGRTGSDPKQRPTAPAGSRVRSSVRRAEPLPADDEADDLTRIVGLGPAARAHLRDRGVFWFRQIAAWRSEDVERISIGAPGLATRIRNGDWIGQAQRLLRKQ